MRRALFCVGLIGVAIALSQRVEAQVTPDGTLNTNISNVGNAFTITNGTAKGANLFHSFGQFSVPIGGAAIFDLGSTPGVSTIFSRVTGGVASDIDGVIGSTVPVNLFLLNPSGILLGANARLQIGGSFVGTTANTIRFADGVELSAAATEPPLLTMSAPIGLQMGQAPGAIVNRSTLLEVAPGKTFALIGGNLTMQGTSGYAYLYVPDGHVELGSVGSNSLVGLTNSLTGWKFDYQGVTAFQDINLDQSSFVEVSGNGGGTMQLRGNKIQLTGGSAIYTYTYGAASDGGITVQASDSVSVVGRLPNGAPTGIGTFVAAGAIGTGGNITIKTPALRVLDGGVVGVEGYGQGNNGNITVQAEQAEILGTDVNGFQSLLYSWVSPSSTGRGGDITLNTQRLTFANGGIIYADTSGKGQGGNLTIKTNTLEGFSYSLQPNSLGSLISIAARGDGNAGTADITAQKLIFNNAAQIFTGTTGSGNGGSLKIQATEIYADRGNYTGDLATAISAGVISRATGNAGNIAIQTQRLTLLNGAQVSGGTFGRGNGGKITVQADEITATGTGKDGLREFPSGISTLR